MVLEPQGSSPDWWSAVAAWVSLALGGILAVIKGIETWRLRGIRGVLKLVMTQDGFVRYGPAGELVFLNLVYMASRRPVLVADVEASIVQYGERDDVINRVPLKLLRVGVPKDRGNPIHDHFFFSSSALDLIAPGTPERRVMMFVVESGQSEISSAMTNFDAQARDIMSSAVSVEDLRIEVDKVVGVLAKVVKENAEIRNGRYQVVLKVHYADVDYDDESVTAEGAMRLEIGSNGGQELETKVANFGRHFAASIADPNVDARFPEVAFERVVVESRLSS